MKDIQETESPMRKKKSRHLLTEVELEFMNELWALEEGTVRKVLARLPKERNLAYTSGATILRILEEKGFVESQREGKSLIYTPLLAKDRIHLDRIPHHYPKYEVIEMFSDKELFEIFDLVGAKNGQPDGQRPSAGFVAIQYFLQKVKYSSLTLVGFDFFSKSLSITAGAANPYSWHLPQNTQEYNPHAKVEKELVLGYERSGKLQWRILSDLNQGSLDLS